MTYDIDAVIVASSAMKEAVNNVGDSLGLPNGWLNMDFKNTASYSDKLVEVSVYFKTFSNVLIIRTVTAEYLIAMKLMSGRQYKNDLSDVAGILWEHQKSGKAIDRGTVDKAVVKLYGEDAELPAVSKKFIDDAFSSGEYEKVYHDIKESEKQSKEILLTFEKDHPSELQGDSISSILERAKQKRDRDRGKSGNS